MQMLFMSILPGHAATNTSRLSTIGDCVANVDASDHFQIRGSHPFIEIGKDEGVEGMKKLQDEAVN